MKSSIIDLFRRAGKPNDIKFRSQLYVFLICLGISVFIWFLISLSQSYVTEVKYQLVYTNLPDDRVLTGDGDETVRLRVRSKGFNLFSLKYLTFRNPILIDLDELYIRKDRESGYNYFLSNQLRQQVISQLDAADQLLTIAPDTVFFGMDKVISREVAIVPRLNLEFRQQYLLYDTIEIIPAILTIKGPESFIDTLSKVYTVHKNLTDLNQNVFLTLAVDKPFDTKTVEYSSTEVEVKIFVEEFTEAILDLPVEMKGLNPEIRIKTFPELVKITYIVALKDYQKVDPMMFKVIATPDTMIDNSNVKIRITETQGPPFVKITKIEPRELDYIILE
ncbi:MAG: hypothetical protein U9R60_06175 [Bacteroidota bacterium]|nr:hypothetical protein [Bacteroidota bacterium]